MTSRGKNLGDLTSNRCLNFRYRDALKSLFTLWTSIVIISVINYYDLVPIALRKYLFPFRTQKSSSVAPIILQQRETRKVPNYKKSTRKGGFFAKNHFRDSFAVVF